MMIPAKMISEIPLPIPRSVICSPSHMMKQVPAVSVTTPISRKPQPGSITVPGPNAPCSIAVAISRPWMTARMTVP